MHAEILALIPARGESKSLPRKNIRLFGGYPLLAYSIAAGRQAQLVKRVLVSTDDDEIAAIARQYGAEVPFIRPAELAQDHTVDLPVFRHALQWLAENENYRPDLVIQLRPTSPLRPPRLVDQAINLLHQNPLADSVRGVVPSGQNPFKMWEINPEGQLTPLLASQFSEPFNMPRQKLPPTYWQTGHIDAIRSTTISEKNSMSGDTILPILIDSNYSVDIDTPRDWAHAEWLLAEANFPIVRPGASSRPLPEQIDLVVLDFDGVLTDNRVWVNADGQEFVAAHRGDGWGLARLQEADIAVAVLSTEVNPVVTARCKKLGIPVIQGVEEKGSALQKLLAERRVDPSRTIYLGNDVNDIPCFPLVGCAVVVADAHPQARAQADFRLQRPGGYGAVRELCDLLISRQTK